MSRHQVGYEGAVEGSRTEDVADYIRRAQRTLSRERAEVKAKRELADAAAENRAWKFVERLRRKLLEALESITQPGDEQRAQEMCQQRLRAFRQSSEERIRAALEAGKAPILAKANVVGYPWFGKVIQFIGQPQVTERVRDDGLVTVTGTWEYEVQ